MFKMLLYFLFVLSIGWADGQKEKSIVKKKVVIVTSDDEKQSRDVEVEANVDDELLKLNITINGEEKEFEVPLDNPEAIKAVEKELEELDVDVHIADFMDLEENEDHDFMHGVKWHKKRDGDGYLGVQIQGLDGQLADYFGAKDGGVLVTEVVENSPAEKAGLKAGDVILSVAGEEVKDSGDLVEEIRGHKPDSKVALNIIRKNTKRKMRVTLGEAPHTFDTGYGPKSKMMFFGDGYDYEDEDVLLTKPHKMLKNFRFYDDEDDHIDELWQELKELREEFEKLKKDS